MFTRPPFRFLSMFVICLAASAAGSGQIPAAGVGSNSGKDSTSPAVEVRSADTSSAPENWIAGYVDPIQGSSATLTLRIFNDFWVFQLASNR
jgi:hypothetical protein